MKKLLFCFLLLTSCKPRVVEVPIAEKVDVPVATSHVSDDPLPERHAENTMAYENHVSILQRLTAAACTFRLPAERNIHDVLYAMRAADYEKAKRLALRLAERKSGEEKNRLLYLAVKADNRLTHSTHIPDGDLILENLEKIPRDLVRYEQCEAALAGKDCDKSLRYRDAIARISEAHYDDLTLKIAKCHADTNQFDERLTPSLKLASSRGTVFQRAKALHFLAERAERNGKKDERRRIEKTMVIKYPSAVSALYPELLASVDDLTPDELYRRAHAFIKHFCYAEARRDLRKVVELSPELREKAQWKIAEISMSNHKEDPTESERIFRDLASKGGKRKQEAEYMVARSMVRGERFAQGLEALESFAKKYPKNPYRARIDYLKGWIPFELRNNEQARPPLLAYGQKYKDTAVLGFYAWTFIREEKWDEAVKAFDLIVYSNNPIVRGKAYYWQAYASIRKKDFDKARHYLDKLYENYPVTYYAVLAYRLEERYMGADFDKKVREMLRFRQDPFPESYQSPYGNDAGRPSATLENNLSETEKLIALDEVDNARKIYVSGRNAFLGNAKDENDEAYFSELFEDYNHAWQKYSGSVRAKSDEYPKRNAVFRMAYPQAFQPLVERLARKYDISPYFVYAIMLQESRFRPRQISSADAIGALQMIPKTAKMIAPVLGLTYDPDAFFNPKIGFEYSIYYMALHRKMWNGNYTLTAGSYNGGPHRIGPWMLRDRGATQDFLVEEFTYDESRHYSRKVSEHMLRYIYLYERDEDKAVSLIKEIFPKDIDYDIPEKDFGY